MGQKKIQMAEYPCVLTLLQKINSVIAVTRDIGVFKRGNFSNKKFGCVITTPDDTEDIVGLWHTQQDLTNNG